MEPGPGDPGFVWGAARCLIGDRVGRHWPEFLIFRHVAAGRVMGGVVSTKSKSKNPAGKWRRAWWVRDMEPFRSADCPSCHVGDFALHFTAHPPQRFWTVPLGPMSDGRMVDGQTSLRHQFPGSRKLSQNRQ